MHAVLQRCDDLGAKASKELGYKALQAWEDAVQEKSLLNKYKGFDVQEIGERYDREHQRNHCRQGAMTCFHVLKVFLCAGFCLSSGPAMLGWLISWNISVVAGTAWIVCLFLAGCLFEADRKNRGFWVISRLENYRKPIPRHAIYQALKIHQEHEGAELFVYEFTVHAENDWKAVDYFLVAEELDMKHFIAGWNEPDFHALPMPTSN